MSKIKAIRGMNDIVPEQMPYWHKLEAAWRDLMQRYSYEELRFPLLETTALFKRSIGEVTDVVEKEMYTFEDRKGKSITLRPEGTAGCVRAGIERDLLYNQIRRLWYTGPMFRYERPQKGRYRQFHQLGLEVFGLSGPEIEYELMLMMDRFWKALGLSDNISLEINALGTLEERTAYIKTLSTYFTTHMNDLDEDSKKRLKNNPLRLLDSKNPAMRPIIQAAPNLLDALGESSKKHFNALKSMLDDGNIVYKVNRHLVRGLDYYTQTVFEWVTTHLGAQGAVCAGGRYDGLVSQLGGHATPAFGLACGIERLVLLMSEQETLLNVPDLYCVLIGQGRALGLNLLETVRDCCKTLRIQTDLSNGKLKSQLKRAHNSGARWVLIFGDDEVKERMVILKDLTGEREQERVSIKAKDGSKYEHCAKNLTKVLAEML